MEFLSKILYFPPVEEASLEGILAVGGDLSVERLLMAYKNGIFPWFNEDEPILWWAPPHRMVVAPRMYKAPKSLRNVVNQNKFQITFNQNFEEVIRNCQQIERTGQDSTWITEDIVTSYCELHQLGHAQSVEVWQNGALVGGLYGVDLGHVFCGESMFSKVPNASKVGFVWLVNYLKTHNYLLLDCQIYNDHLHLLGCVEISRDNFMKILQAK